jgi:hypothetical protein
MSRCTHTHGRTLCFECFRAGMEHTRARRDAWAQRSLPFEAANPTKPLSAQAVAHRRQMLDYLATTGRRRA